MGRKKLRALCIQHIAETTQPQGEKVLKIIAFPTDKILAIQIRCPPLKTNQKRKICKKELTVFLA